MTCYPPAKADDSTSSIGGTRVKLVSDVQTYWGADGTKYSAKGYWFVAAVFPTGTTKVFIDRSRALNIHTHHWIAPRPSGYSIVPISKAADYFQINLSMNAITPYTGPWKIDELPTITCAELGGECGGRP